MRTLIVTLAAMTLLAACGYKGPLYLPKTRPATAVAAPQAPRDASVPAADASSPAGVAP